MGKRLLTLGLALLLLAGAVPALADETGIAYAATQTVYVDDQRVTFQMYALKDANGNLTNYVKVRDVAFVLSATAAQFDVAWNNGAVNLVLGQAYNLNGSEMYTPFQGDQPYSVVDGLTTINGTPTHLSAILLTDKDGGGYTYYKLRDLGRMLGFNVGWKYGRGVYIETDRSYQG